MGPDWKESQIHGMGSYLGTWQSLAGVLWGQFSGLQCSVYCCRFAVQHGERLVSPSFIVLICKMDNNHTYQVGLGQENSWQHLCATCVWQEVMHLTRSLCSVLCFPRHWASVPIPWLARSEGACLKGPCHLCPRHHPSGWDSSQPPDLKTFILNHLLKTVVFPVTRLVGKGLGQGETVRRLPGCVSFSVVRARGEEERS